VSARANGSLAVLYLQLTAGQTLKGTYRVARSTDGGRHTSDAAVSPSFALTNAPLITPSPLIPGGYFVGDYMGVAPLAGGGFGELFVVAQPKSGDKTDVFYVSR
jgi:hypothetical protein